MNEHCKVQLALHRRSIKVAHTLSVCLSHMLADSRQSEAHTVLRDCVKNDSALQGPASSTSAYSIEVDRGGICDILSHSGHSISHILGVSPSQRKAHMVTPLWCASQAWMRSMGVRRATRPGEAQTLSCAHERAKFTGGGHTYTDTRTQTHCLSPTQTHTLTPTPTYTYDTHAHAANRAGQPSEANAESGSLLARSLTLALDGPKNAPRPEMDLLSQRSGALNFFVKCSTLVNFQGFSTQVAHGESPPASTPYVGTHSLSSIYVPLSSQSRCLFSRWGGSHTKISVQDEVVFQKLTSV